jgi:nitrogen fixation-related uncharacterized protein
MLAMTPNDAVLVVWVAVAALSLLAVTAVLVWAVRSGQFSRQDHCRYLPLESGIPQDQMGSAKVRSAEKKSRRNN